MRAYGPMPIVVGQSLSPSLVFINWIYNSTVEMEDGQDKSRPRRTFDEDKSTQPSKGIVPSAYRTLGLGEGEELLWEDTYCQNLALNSCLSGISP